MVIRRSAEFMDGIFLQVLVICRDRAIIRCARQGGKSVHCVVDMQDDWAWLASMRALIVLVFRACTAKLDNGMAVIRMHPQV